MTADNRLSRRDFLKLSTLGVAALFIPPRFREFFSPENSNSILTFSDEFDETKIDETKWMDRYHNGKRTLGTELETYVPFSEGHHIVNNGVLHLVADKADNNSKLPFKSSMIASTNFAQTYGIFEASMKLPKGKGLWPAFWLLPYTKEGQIFPPEIDIVESLGDKPNYIHGANHIACNFPDQGKFCNLYDNFDYISKIDLTDSFHTYKLIWFPNKLLWFFDSKCVYESKDERVPNKPMFPIFNLAIGGWAGEPDQNTKFPTSLDIEYFRVYSLPNKIQDI